jgi:hypothetical protein
MWNTADLTTVSPLSVQKRIGFNIGYTEVANYIGNLTLAPQAIPTEQRSKYIVQAIIKELLTKEHTTINKQECLIPSDFERICATDLESVLMIIDSYVLPDLCLIKKETADLPLAIVMQIRPFHRKLKGVSIFDYGYTEKQTIHLSPQKLIHIPVGHQQELKVTLDVTIGETSLVQETPIPIPDSSLGLIIDTRDSDILIESSLQQARQLVSEWFESMDLQVSEM